MPQYFAGPVTVPNITDDTASKALQPTSVEIASTQVYRTGEITVQSEIFVIWDVSGGADYYEVAVFDNGSSPESVPLHKVSREQAINALWNEPDFADVEYDQGFGGIIIPALKPFSEYKAAVRGVTYDGYVTEWSYSSNVITTGAPLGAYLVNNTFNVQVTYKGVELSWENSKDVNDDGEYKSTVYQCVVEINLSSGDPIKRFVKGESLFVKLETGTHIESITITPLNSKNEYNSDYVVTKTNDGAGWTIPKFLEVEDEVAIQSWTYSGSLYASDFNAVSVNSGSIVLADGTILDAPNNQELIVGSDWEYIYYDPEDQAFAVTDTYSEAVRSGRIYVGVARASADEDKPAWLLTSGSIKNGWSMVLTADYIAANTITANEINVNDLFAQNIEVSGSIHGGKSTYDDDTAGWWMGRYATDDYRFKIGDASKYLSWDGSLNLIGATISTSSGDDRIVLNPEDNTIEFYSTSSTPGSPYQTTLRANYGELTLRDSNGNLGTLRIDALEGEYTAAADYPVYRLSRDAGLKYGRVVSTDGAYYDGFSGVYVEYYYRDQNSTVPRIRLYSDEYNNSFEHFLTSDLMNLIIHSSAGVLLESTFIAPATNDTQSVGTSDLKFNDGYFTNLHVDNLVIAGLDADTLDGHDSTYFLGNVEISGGEGKDFLHFDEGGTNKWIDVTAADMRGYLELDSYYLGITAKAADSDKLDGVDISEIINSEHNYVVRDTRDTDTPTDLGNRGVKFEFKNNATDSLADGGTYHGVITFQPWADSSGGNTYQLGFTINGNLFLRTAVIGATDWGAWHKFWHDGNDGSGSGLDADLLDGYEAAHFMAANATMYALSDVDNYQGIQSSGFLRYSDTDAIWYTEDAATFRTSLGLGDAATKNVGTVSGTVAAGDHLHDSRYLQLSGGTITGDLSVDNDLTVSGNLEVSIITYGSLVAPTNLSLTESNGDVTVTFSQSSSPSIDEYEVWRSESSDTSGFVLIAIINQDDIPSDGSDISVIDDSIDKNATIYYRIYAIKTGIRSSALTGSIAVSSAIPDVTNLQVIPSLDYYIINYDIPDDDRFDHVEIYMDKVSDTNSFDRTNATLVYTGKRCTFVYKIPDADKDLYHQFWVEAKVRS